jgi:hypothetical protein
VLPPEAMGGATAYYHRCSCTVEVLLLAKLWLLPSRPKKLGPSLVQAR